MTLRGPDTKKIAVQVTRLTSDLRFEITLLTNLFCCLNFSLLDGLINLYWVTMSAFRDQKAPAPRLLTWYALIIYPGLNTEGDKQIQSFSAN